MAIELRASVPGLTQEMYDGIIQQVGPMLQAAPGFIAHAGGATEDGWGVTELWESQAQAEAWLNDTIAPQMRNAGFAVPTPQFRQIHTVLFTSKG